ncbi:MAG: sigma-54 dependent transcriptional regulator [Pseudomonadota bacterium]
MATLLVIDDEPSILESLSMFLSEKGHEVFTADTAAKGMDLFLERLPKIVILDIRLPDMNGLDLLQDMAKQDFPFKIIMITAFQDMKTTVLAIKRGAFDYIHKPLDVGEIEKAVNRAIDILNIDEEVRTVDNREHKPQGSNVIIGKSEEMRSIFKKMGLVCTSRVNVLIQGETGTGKELIARAIHLNSGAGDEPFIVFDCSAVVGSLIESELFGHEKGAFTGAETRTQGKIELAGTGTLFLDEISQLPLHVQGKLLGFLQRREYTRVGGGQILKSCCRIIAAGNRDLAEEVRHDRFKEDLYYRLKVFMIHVPALRERLSDIPLLVEHFLNKVNQELGTRVTRLQEGVNELLMAHPWKGNVRELENTIVEAVVGCRGNVLLREDVAKILAMSDALPLMGLESFSLANAEKNHILKTLAHLDWNRTRAADLLGITRPTLRSKIKKYKIQEP